MNCTIYRNIFSKDEPHYISVDIALDRIKTGKSQKLIEEVRNCIDKERAKKIKLNKGVYVAVMGPNLETRAEYRFLHRIGADAVGMSTVPEVLVANHMGLPCCAISVLTDDCDPDNLKPAALSEIVAVANKTEPRLTELYMELIAKI